MRKYLPTGFNYPDIVGSVIQAHPPAPCEYCGKMATSKSLMISRRKYQMDLCAACRYRKYAGILEDPREDAVVEGIPDEYMERGDLPF